ncbi:hypothetical protein RB653_007618 [Dictyostelium firmibasis]|uniref:Peptidase M20 dimerisation domain-containing protein n=1 Tax=Dictyostelium firmibasis TaxID=79012 RepID=A0AAN7TNW5_9MYCE
MDRRNQPDYDNGKSKSINGSKTTKSTYIKIIIRNLFIGILLMLVLNTIRFTSKQPKVEILSPDHVDSYTTLSDIELAHRLAKATTFKTISFGESPEFDQYEPEFLKFHQFLRETFPKVHQYLNLNIIANYSLVYHWKGLDEQSLKPILLAGHIDVVPTLFLDKWTHPPFAGIVDETYIWGRGTMDDKGSVMAILESVEDLLRQGFKPQRSIYLAFGHDEELGGNTGAHNINKYFNKNQIGPFEYILDEGLPILLPPVFPGLSKPIASVGITEKGAMDIRLSVTIVGGHSSMPRRESAIGVLAKAVSKLENNPPSPKLRETRLLFDFVGRECSLPYRFLFSNLWLFEPVISRVLASKPTLDALQRTTTALTIFNAGNKANVIPMEASATINFRIAPGDTTNDIIEHVNRVIGDDRVVISKVSNVIEPAPVSSTNSPAFNLLQSTILQEFPDVVVAPTIMIANTDTRHYWNLTENIFRFCPMVLENIDLQRLHGIDERLTIKNYKQLVDFYYHLIKNGERFL